MQTFVKNAVFSTLFSVVFLLVLSVPLQAQVLAHSAEVSGTVGYDNTSFTPTEDAPTSKYFYGGSGGFNVTSHFTVLGEYKYDPYTSAPGDNFSYHSQLYGGAARYNILSLRKIVPYVVGGYGGYQITASYASNTVSHNGYYFNGGAGVSVFLGRNFGVRPELRYERQHFISDNTDFHSNVANLSGSFFYQFGGTGKKK